MELVLLGLLIVVIALGIVLLIRQSTFASRQTDAGLEEKLRALLSDSKQDILSMSSALFKQSAESQNAQIAQLQQSQSAQTETLRKTVVEHLAQMEARVKELEARTEAQGTAMRTTLADGMKQLREENTKKLDEIKGTVDEKLQTTLEKRITESFRTVSQQLEQVYKSMGEMQTLATDVGGLKKVLSGVKTRGILGEVRLKSILEEILPPEQYEENAATVPGSSERVEFAIRLPGTDEHVVYLPIDSKFPGERYQQLLDAQETGDKAAVDAAFKALERVLRDEAKDIHEKYVQPPSTTRFAIMFLPFEGLYAEVLSRNLVEPLQREYQVNVAGPSTMAAYLNSLQMGFQTLAIQKRSSEVWDVLKAVKSEFDKFEELLRNMQRHLELTAKDLESLAGTRTRAIQKKLRGVELLDGTLLPELPEADEPEA